MSPFPAIAYGRAFRRSACSVTFERFVATAVIALILVSLTIITLARNQRLAETLSAMLAAPPGEFGPIKTPFIEKWEKELEEVTGAAQDPHYLQQLHGWAGGEYESTSLRWLMLSVVPKRSS